MIEDSTHYGVCRKENSTAFVTGMVQRKAVAAGRAGIRPQMICSQKSVSISQLCVAFIPRLFLPSWLQGAAF